MRSSFKILCILIGLILFSACGYHLAGTGTSTLPKHLKTVAIPVFENTSSEPDIHRNMTNVIRQSFINDGRLKVVNTKNADLVMRGVLNSYALQAVSFDSNDVAVEYYVALGVAINVKDMVKRKQFLRQNFTTKWDFRTTADVINSEAARQTALNDAYAELGNRLVSIVIDQF
jgi:outer membrane lipopolysaccharide assembly protein LptE/RlpB